MNVVDLSYAREPLIGTPDDLFAKHRTTQGLAEALAVHVERVTVVRSLPTEGTLQQNGVDYIFYRGGGSERWSIPWGLHRRLAAMHPDIVHVHGLMFPLQLIALRRQLPRDTAIVVQHHAENPAYRLKRLVQRQGARCADGFLFTAKEQADPWLDTGAIADSGQIFEVMEGSTRFRAIPRSKARAITGLVGDPVLIWIGRLNANKDPMAVLDGLEQIGERLPTARLYMIYHDHDLLEDVQRRINASEFLSRVVFLCGQVRYEEIERYLNSADYFVLGSHYEGSGFALAEALACGCIPVVTDIPSFHMMTHDGRLGSLWPAGSGSGFASALMEAMGKPREEESTACVRHFEQTLSFEAIGRITAEHYREVVAHRRMRR